MNAAPATDPPRLLLAEDDPVSAAFLAEAAAALPLAVHVAPSAAEARTAATQATFDLLLLDAHLPDGSGIELLAALRAAGQTAPALAHTADASESVARVLCAAGFREVLHKPIAMAALHDALRRHLPLTAAARWDDAAALAALGGQGAHVATLRRLFLDELPQQHARIAAALEVGDVEAIRAELHRLTASCGLVGARALARQVQALREAPLEPSRWQAFDAEIGALLSASPPAPPAARG